MIADSFVFLSLTEASALLCLVSSPPRAAPNPLLFPSPTHSLSLASTRASPMAALDPSPASPRRQCLPARGSCFALPPLLRVQHQTHSFSWHHGHHRAVEAAVAPYCSHLLCARTSTTLPLPCVASTVRTPRPCRRSIVRGLAALSLLVMPPRLPTSLPVARPPSSSACHARCPAAPPRPRPPLPYLLCKRAPTIIVATSLTSAPCLCPP